MVIISILVFIFAITSIDHLYNSIGSGIYMKVIGNNSAGVSIPKPIPPEWEFLRRKVASQAGRHAIIAGGAIR
jgi:hypothetical protein